MKKYRSAILYSLLSIVMTVQIVLGILWMVRNFSAIPGFGDSTEYLEISQTFVMDEYRPVLYPLFLRIMTEIQDLIHVPYQKIVYSIQIFISFFSILFGVSTIDRITKSRNKQRKRRWIFRLFISLYIITIPMMTIMNLSILTDSLATSMLILFLTSLILLFEYERIPVWNYILMILTLLVESLLRADRLYSCLVLAILVFVVRLFKRKTGRIRILAGMLTVCILTTGITMGVNHLTQTPGVKGRIQTNFEFVLLDRIVWPNMRANYKYFPKEIKKAISKEDAKTFDKHNNNVMYQMAPMLEEKYGTEKAREMYAIMAKTVLKHMPGKVLWQISRDFLKMIGTPISSFMNAHKWTSKGDSWNITCASQVDEDLTRAYNLYFQDSFMLLLIFGVFFFLFRTESREKYWLKKFIVKLMPFWGYGIVLSLWFCLGDGAPPNDRYALIIYFNWAIMVLGLWNGWSVLQ